MPRTESRTIEGIDNILFSIVSPEILSKLNELKNNHPSGKEWPDYRLRKTISAEVPIYSANLTADERDKRLLYGGCSEIVDLKQKVLHELLLDPPLTGDPNYDKRLKEYNDFWGNVIPRSVLQIESVKHDIGPVGSIHNPLRRIVIDFIIRSDNLANVISSKNAVLSPLVTQSELEIRIPDKFYDYSQYLSQLKNRLRDIEWSLLLALGIPSSEIPTVDSNDFKIISIGYLTTPWQRQV